MLNTILALILLPVPVLILHTVIVSYTGNWVCDTALIGCTLGLGKTREGSGFRREGYKGTMGDKGSQFTSNLGLRWTIPVTAGGKGNAAKGDTARGNMPCVVAYITHVRVYTRMIELMKDTS